MKGISPVIATILLLLMAVASVGGAWIWYQRQSNIVSGETEEKLQNQLDQQKSSSVTLAGIYLDGSNVALLINNAGSSNANMTGYKITTGGSSDVNTSLSQTLTAGQTTNLITLSTCTTNADVKIQLYVGGTSTAEFLETCP